MKYLSLVLLIAAAMTANMVADLNFVDGTHDARGWDFMCGSIIMVSAVVLIGLAIIDTIKELDL